MNILVLNSGSSSRKSRLYELGGSLPDSPPPPLWKAKIEWGDKGIIGLILRTAAKPIAGGLLAGLSLALGASYALAKLMKNAPFVLNTHDPVAYLSVSLLLVLSSTVAMLIPALRATKENPVKALREE
jgi:hypothetical protein